MRVHRLPIWQRLLCSAVSTVGGVGLVLWGLDDGGWTPVWTLLAAVALSVLAVRSWQLRVETGPGVVVINWLRTHRLAWREVKRFTADSGGVEVELRDGRRVGVAVFAATNSGVAWFEGRNRRAALELERARRQHRDNARPGWSR